VVEKLVEVAVYGHPNISARVEEILVDDSEKKRKRETACQHARRKRKFEKEEQDVLELKVHSERMYHHVLQREHGRLCGLLRQAKDLVKLYEANRTAPAPSAAILHGVHQEPLHYHNIRALSTRRTMNNDALWMRSGYSAFSLAPDTAASPANTMSINSGRGFPSTTFASVVESILRGDLS